MKRIHGLLTGLAASLLFCACGAGDEDAPSVGEAASEDRASEQVEAAQSTDELDSDGQTAAVLTSCRTVCTTFSNTNLTGQCCICNGVQRTFRKSPLTPNLYLCL